MSRKTSSELGPISSFWNLPRVNLTKALGSPADGLDDAEAARRHAVVGRNQESETSPFAAVSDLVRLVLNPLVLILLVASAVSAVLGDRVGSLIVLAIVLISVLLDFYQTSRSQQAARTLAKLIVTTATVRRGGKPREVPFDDLVPGDVIELSAGDLVPADARLLQSRFLAVNQAALTGESLPVDKVDADLDRPTADPSEATNAVFLGSAVVSGTAMALVVNTGAATELGQIGHSLHRKPAATEFERGMHGFSSLIARTVLFLVLLVFFFNAWFGRSPLESFLFAVALAVGLTPEFMPMIVTVTLAEGALRMAKKRVIVRHLQAIQNFGAIDVLCSDKTGTLTRGKVQVERLVRPFGGEDARLIELAYLNAAFETGFSNLLDEALRALACPAAAEHLVKVDELPFDFVRRRSSVVLRDPSGGTSLLVTKGAPESVVPACRFVEGQEGIRDLGDAERLAIQNVFETESARGCRSLAVAYRPLDGATNCELSDEDNLTFVGLVSFADPPLDDVAATIAGLQADGVSLKILTGDDAIIARHVCEEVGLDVARVVTGPEIDRLGDTALGTVAETANLFARLTPIQKNRVLSALQARGHVVGFLGDGINDAPSLHAADVGISVASATDVARDAAEIILLDSSLAVLREGIVEGRKSFGNIMKYIMMGTSSNFGNMFSMAGATLFLPFLPLRPVQILLNNLLYDLSQVMLPADDVDPELTVLPKKWDMRLIRDFMLVFGPISSVFDYLTFGLLWLVYHATPALFRTGWFVESLASQILVIYVIRTIRLPWKSRPSRGLVISTLGALAVGLLFPFSPLADDLGFTSLPLSFFAFLFVAVVVYLLLVDLAKVRFFQHHRL
ncbi:MAG TPA: magnesium-translocating P-type ATPase [Chloroflexota bacterium]|nr:magnesium-translocating P-type ATPase [Chloroflexota bacterium]